MRTREEHLAWCKEQALKYLKEGDITNAITSMLSDLEKHPETRGVNSYLALLGMKIIQDSDETAAHRFIEGFH